MNLKVKAKQEKNSINNRRKNNCRIGKMCMWFGKCGNFPYAGTSNVGQISNKIAIELEKQNAGYLMCAIGVETRASGLVRSAEASDKIIAIEGARLTV